MPPYVLGQFEYAIEDYAEGHVILNGSTGNGNDLTDWGGFVDVHKIMGLDSAPVRSSSRSREGVDGGYVESQFRDSRVVTVEGLIYLLNNTNENLLDRLKAEYGPRADNSATKWFFLHDSSTAETRFIWAKPQGFRYNTEAVLRRTGVVPFSLILLCEDPSQYGETLISTSVFMGGGSSLFLPTPFPLDFGTSGASAGTTNGGNKNSYPMIKIYGPATRPKILHAQSGKYLELDLTLVTSESIWLDTFTREVFAANDRSIDRSYALTSGSSWWTLTPGANTIYMFTTSDTGYVTIEHYDAWE